MAQMLLMKEIFSCSSPLLLCLFLANKTNKTVFPVNDVGFVNEVAREFNNSLKFDPSEPCLGFTIRDPVINGKIYMHFYTPASCFSSVHPPIRIQYYPLPFSQQPCITATSNLVWCFSCWSYTSHNKFWSASCLLSVFLAGFIFGLCILG